MAAVVGSGWFGPSIGTGGSGGGGNGSYNANGNPGTANTGGGGGGSGGVNPRIGGTGGSGIVLIRYPIGLGSGKCSGGTQTNDGTYYIHTFTGSGTFTVN